MIDIEQEIYELLVNKLSASFSDLHCYNLGMPNKATFPCVTIEQTDNSVVESTQDSGSNENHVTTVFDVNAYSTKANGRKAECKEILQVVDDELSRLGFTRLSMVSFSESNATRYRITARYVAVVSKNKTIYRR